MSNSEPFYQLCSNGRYFDKLAKKAMLKGIIKETVQEVDLPPGQMIFRFGSTLQVKYPKGCDADNDNYDEAAMNRFLAEATQDSISKRRLVGCWWQRSAQMTNLKYASFSRNAPLSVVGREALMVRHEWSNMDYLICARVNPGVWLGAYEGKGREQFETLKDGSTKHWPENPHMEQLYIPGLDSLPNIHTWLTLDHVQMIKVGGV